MIWTSYLGGTVATVGFPDIGLQGFKETNDEGRMKNEETKRQTARVNWHFFLLPSSFFISPSLVTRHPSHLLTLRRSARILLATRRAFGFHSGVERRFSRNGRRAGDAVVAERLVFWPVHRHGHAGGLFSGLAAGGGFRAGNRKAGFHLGR
jgi:hypothetical protein